MAKQTNLLDQALAAHYPIHAIADEDGGWYISFPDLPGCTTYADSWQELASNAHEAVTSWLTIEDERGHQLPPPTIGGESTWQPGDFLVSSISKSTDATPLTTQDVAARLGVTPRRVQALARRRKVGRRPE
ncbi:MAG: type II toxin-antitoxin system HicB family antitoxin [Thermomicrobiales bacterium]